MNNEKKHRIEIMDGLFRKGKPVSFLEVAKELNKVFNKCKSPAAYSGLYSDTFRKDMQTIREVLDNPLNGIAHDMLQTAGGNRNRTYWYADPSFSIIPYLTYYYKNSDYKMLDKALELLRDTLPDDVFDSVEFSIKSHVEYEFGKGEKGIDYGENLKLKGRHWLPLLYQAVNKTALRITYKPYKFDAYSYILYPYLLKQHNNRWFLFGRIDEVKKEYLKDPNEKIQDVNQDYWIVPLDRIENVEVLKDVPFIPRPAHYEGPLTEVIGVTNKKPDPIEIIRFIAKGSTAYYIATKPLHASQDSQWIDNETLDVKLQVKINPELTHLLLSYAPDITILSPQSLVEEHKNSLKIALEQYQ